MMAVMKASVRTTHMKIRQLIDLRADGGINYTSPASPVGVDYTEAYLGISPISKVHPPSLKNPKEVAIPTAQDGWHKDDSKAAKRQAREDLAIIHQRLRRQLGKPEVSQTALFPIFPDIARNL